MSNMLQVLYKNNQLIACDKPSGITVHPDKTGDAAFLEQVEAYCKHPVHVVNRLDRPVSGIMLFAKSKSAMTALTEQFRQRSVRKQYLAVVQQAPAQPEGHLVHYLKKNEAKNTAVAYDTEQPGTERAELHYRLLSSSERYHLLLIEMHTGRHHQVRAQLAAIGCPIKGDVKYGFRRSNPDRSIHLHAWRIEFEHPVSGERVALEAPPPADPLWAALTATASLQAP